MPGNPFERYTCTVAREVSRAMTRAERHFMQKQPHPQQQIQVQLDESAAEGIYSNFVLTGNTHAEFILDFARMLPGLPKAKVLSRIIMTPQSAKSLQIVLTRTIEQFEKNFGEIKMRGGRESSQIGFQAKAGTPECGADE